MNKIQDSDSFKKKIRFNTDLRTCKCALAFLCVPDTEDLLRCNRPNYEYEQPEIAREA